MISSTAAFVLLALISVSAGQVCRTRNPNPCADFCKFTFCIPTTNNPATSDRTVKGPRLLFRDPGVATYPYVCTASGPSQIVKIRKVGQAKVACANTRPRDFVDISQYQRGSVRPPFPKKFIGLKEITFPPLPGFWGITKRKSKGNQDDFLDDICVQIPLLRYQLKTGSRVRNVRGNSREDCVGFRGVIGELIIEFTWNGGEDFDLSVMEPSPGVTIDRLNDRSPTGGRLIKDNNIGTCGIAPVGREQVTYRTRATPIAGIYGVKVLYFNDCGVDVTWSLAVIARGRVLKTVTGTATPSQQGTNVLDTTFTYP